jgi:hypothetical protein
MGAELGSTGDPTALVPGRPAVLAGTAQAWRSYGDALHQAGTGLARIDTTDGWTGPAGEAFRARFEGQPTAWLTAGDSFHHAAAALDGYGSALTEAQGQAADAIRQWNGAQAATDRAVSERARDVRATGQSLPFVDPGEPLRQQAQRTLDSARGRVRTAGDAAAAAIGGARDAAPDGPGFWSQVGDVAAHVGAELANVGATVVNAAASYGNAVLHHPLEAGTEVAGGIVTVLGAGGEIAGFGLDLTGVGAVVGVPAGVVSAAAIAGGLALATPAAASLAAHATGDDRIEVMRTDRTGTGDGEFEPTEGFRGSEFSRDEIEEFVNGHTGDRMPGADRPTRAEVSRVLDEATPEKLEGQNAEEFIATVNGEKIKVIVNYDVPWRSTAYRIGG